MPSRLFALPILGALLLAGCVPGPVIHSPAVSGTVTDAHSGRPIAGAMVTLDVSGRIPLRNGISSSEPRGVSDGDGHFMLPAKYGLGLIGFMGDPPCYLATVRASKAGYHDFVAERQCNGADGGPSAPLQVDASLIPGHGAGFQEDISRF